MHDSQSAASGSLQADALNTGQFVLGAPDSTPLALLRYLAVQASVCGDAPGQQHVTRHS